MCATVALNFQTTHNYPTWVLDVASISAVAFRCNNKSGGSIPAIFLPHAYLKPVKTVANNCR
jgi:hypothetical protein